MGTWLGLFCFVIKLLLLLYFVNDAAKRCEDVIQKSLPWMETKNVLNTFELAAATDLENA
jgi:hypothetical protein